MAALSMIWLILSQMESIWVIMAIIMFGACVGVFSTRYIRRIDESSALIEAARRSIMPEIREAWKIPKIRKLIFAMYTAYMAVIMLGASSMLSIKRGYGVSDTAALYFSLMQFLASALFSWISAKIIRKHGSKFAIMWSFYILLIGSFPVFGTTELFIDRSNRKLNTNLFLVFPNFLIQFQQLSAYAQCFLQILLVF
jgi:hypothetical protein